jgi:lipooligosaccharide transport system permease protein
VTTDRILLGNLRMTPILLARPARSLRLVERSVTVYSKNWFFILSGFAEPFFYLLSIGVGLSHLVGSVTLDGHPVSYARFVAPGLLATSAMNGAILDTTYNFFFKLKVSKTFEAVVATPLSIADIAFGEVGWALLRGSIYSTGFLVVMAGFGLVTSPWALLCLPATMLVALCFGSLGIAASSYMRTWQDLSGVALAMLPLFLFSGTFYAITIYPRAVAIVVEATPLYQGVVICRGLTNGVVPPSLAWHALYLALVASVSLVIAVRRLGRRLAK